MGLGHTQQGRVPDLLRTYPLQQRLAAEQGASRSGWRQQQPCFPLVCRPFQGSGGKREDLNEETGTGERNPSRGAPLGKRAHPETERDRTVRLHKALTRGTQSSSSMCVWRVIPSAAQSVMGHLPFIIFFSAKATPSSIAYLSRSQKHRCSKNCSAHSSW